MAEIEFNEVSKVYDGGTLAVLDLDLKIQDGEIWWSSSARGCGKSTALRMAAGLEATQAAEDPDRRPRRHDVAADRARHRDGVPELRALPAHDVFENIASD